MFVLVLARACRRAVLMRRGNSARVHAINAFTLPISRATRGRSSFGCSTLRRVRGKADGRRKADGRDQEGCCR